MASTFAVDCSTCGLQYGPFPSFESASAHAADFGKAGHDCDATDKPVSADSLNLTSPDEHSRA